MNHLRASASTRRDLGCIGSRGCRCRLCLTLFPPWLKSYLGALVAARCIRPTYEPFGTLPLFCWATALWTRATTAGVVGALSALVEAGWPARVDLDMESPIRLNTWLGTSHERTFRQLPVAVHPKMITFGAISLMRPIRLEASLRMLSVGAISPNA